MIQIRALAFVMTMVLAYATAVLGAGGFKCGARIVRIGDTSLEVLNTCGEPSFREYVGTESGGFYSRERREWDSESDRSLTRGRYGEFSVDVERWYYDCGRNKFIRILTFKGGILRGIRMGRDYGVGASDCIGRASGSSSKEPEREDAASFGTVSILGTPYGAQIYLDQEHVAEIPATLERMEPGAYNLTVRSRGYRDWAKRIVVEPNETVYVNVYLDRQENQAGESDSEGEKTVSEPPATIYKWTDEEGTIHITDTPPPKSE